MSGMPQSTNIASLFPPLTSQSLSSLVDVIWCMRALWGSRCWEAHGAPGWPSRTSTSTSSMTCCWSPWKSRGFTHAEIPHKMLVQHIASSCHWCSRTNTSSSLPHRGLRFHVLDYAAFPSHVCTEPLKEVTGLPSESFLLRLSRNHAGQAIALILVPHTMWEFADLYHLECKTKWRLRR